VSSNCLAEGREPLIPHDDSNLSFTVRRVTPRGNTIGGPPPRFRDSQNTLANQHNNHNEHQPALGYRNQVPPLNLDHRVDQVRYAPASHQDQVNNSDESHPTYYHGQLSANFHGDSPPDQPSYYGNWDEDDDHPETGPAQQYDTGSHPFPERRSSLPSYVRSAANQIDDQHLVEDHDQSAEEYLRDIYLGYIRNDLTEETGHPTEQFPSYEETQD
jgi:hypothetical protein